MNKSRFKIDFYDSGYRPFGLYFAEKKMFGFRWKFLTSFENRADAMTFYDRIKDLPEYLA